MIAVCRSFYKEQPSLSISSSDEQQYKAAQEDAENLWKKIEKAVDKEKRCPSMAYIKPLAARVRDDEQMQPC